MRANRVEYHAPARFDDLLEVFVRVERIGTSSAVFQFAACDEHGVDLCTAEQVVVLIDRATRRPVTVGEAYRRAVDLFEGRTPRSRRCPTTRPAGRRGGAVDAVERIVEPRGRGGRDPAPGGGDDREAVRHVLRHPLRRGRRA